VTQPKSPPGGQGARAKSNSELGLRLASGLVLAALALALVKIGSWPFIGLIVLASAIVAWEWSGLVAGQVAKPVYALFAGSLLSAIALTATGEGLYGMAVLAGGALLTAFAGGLRTGGAWLGAGVLYVGLPATALVWLRMGDANGWFAVLFLFLIVWSTDTGAYITGRYFGGPRLAPRISPHKTWSGAIGGIAISAAIACVFALWLGGTSPFALVLVAIFLAIVAEFGDLAESAIKRRFQVKDTGTLIPGHGGLLDRVDALLFAAVAAALLAMVRSPCEPAKALLIWP
jgi:phosphatidate cytidylyltransferase